MARQPFADQKLGHRTERALFFGCQFGEGVAHAAGQIRGDQSAGYLVCFVNPHLLYGIRHSIAVASPCGDSFANKNSQSFALRSAFGTRNVADMGECYLIELHGMSLRIVSGFNGHNNGADTLRAGFTLKVCDRQRETGDNGFRKLPTSPRPRFGLGRRVVYYPARWLDWSRPFFRVGDGPGPLGIWQLTAAGARTPYVLS